MPYYPNLGAVVSQTLASAVANGGTFTVSYPTGYSQQSFNTGLEVPSSSYVIVNKNDKFNAYGDSGARFNLSYGASNVTVTNNLGYSLPAGTTIDVFFDQRDNTNVSILAFPVVALADVTAADIVTDFKPGINGVLEHVWFQQGKAVTTAAKAATVTPYIDGAAPTGGVISLTSAACTPMGVRVDGTQITAGNTINMNSKISLTASAVTAFVEGNGTFYARVRHVPT